MDPPDEPASRRRTVPDRMKFCRVRNKVSYILMPRLPTQRRNRQEGEISIPAWTRPMFRNHVLPWVRRPRSRTKYRIAVRTFPPLNLPPREKSVPTPMKPCRVRDKVSCSSPVGTAGGRRPEVAELPVRRNQPLVGHVPRVLPEEAGRDCSWHGCSPQYPSGAEKTLARQTMVRAPTGTYPSLQAKSHDAPEAVSFPHAPKVIPNFVAT